MGEGVSPGERETVDHTQAIAQELRDKGVQVLGDEARQNPAQVRESLQKVSEQLPEVVADAQRAAEKLQQNPEYQALGQQVDNVVTALGQHSSPELKRLGQDAAFVQRLRDGDKAAWGELGTTTQQHETEEHKAQSEALSTAAAKFTEAFRQRDDKQLEVLEIWDDQEKQLYLGKDKGSKPIEGKAALVDKVIEQAEAIDDPQKRQEFLEKRARGNINDQIARAERKLTTLQTQLSELQAKKDRFIALAQADGQADKTQLDQERNALTEEMDLLRTNLADARDNGMLSSGDEYGARHFLSRIDTAIGNSDGGVLGPVSAGEISGLFDKLENETQALTVAELRIQQAREKVAEEATKAAARMSELIALDLNATSAQAELDDVVKKITQTPEGKIYSAETTVMASALAEKVSKAREQMLSEEDSRADAISSKLIAELRDTLARSEQPVQQEELVQLLQHTIDRFTKVLDRVQRQQEKKKEGTEKRPNPNEINSMVPPSSEMPSRQGGSGREAQPQAAQQGEGTPLPASQSEIQQQQEATSQPESVAELPPDQAIDKLQQDYTQFKQLIDQGAYRQRHDTFTQSMLGVKSKIDTQLQSIDAQLLALKAGEDRTGLAAERSQLIQTQEKFRELRDKSGAYDQARTGATAGFANAQEFGQIDALLTKYGPYFQELHNNVAIVDKTLRPWAQLIQREAQRLGARWKESTDPNVVRFLADYTEDQLPNGFHRAVKQSADKLGIEKSVEQTSAQLTSELAGVGSWDELKAKLTQYADVPLAIMHGNGVLQMKAGEVITMLENERAQYSCSVDQLGTLQPSKEEYEQSFRLAFPSLPDLGAKAAQLISGEKRDELSRISGQLLNRSSANLRGFNELLRLGGDHLLLAGADKQLTDRVRSFRGRQARLFGRTFNVLPRVSLDRSRSGGGYSLSVGSGEKSGEQSEQAVQADQLGINATELADYLDTLMQTKEQWMWKSRLGILRQKVTKEDVLNKLVQAGAPRENPIIQAAAEYLHAEVVGSQKKTEGQVVAPGVMLGMEGQGQQRTAVVSLETGAQANIGYGSESQIKTNKSIEFTDLGAKYATLTRGPDGSVRFRLNTKAAAYHNLKPVQGENGAREVILPDNRPDNPHIIQVGKVAHTINVSGKTVRLSTNFGLRM